MASKMAAKAAGGLVEISKVPCPPIALSGAPKAAGPSKTPKKQTVPSRPG